MENKFKSLRSGKSITVIPVFQPVKISGDVNKGDKKVNDEHTDDGKIKSES